MGKLKDNTISGFLPTAQVFAVHYPGYPSSKRRAVETLGGKQSILKVRDLQSNKLELRFRPEDPYSHPTHGELRPCSCFLLKICHPKSDSTEGIKKVEKEVPREDEINLDFEMVACVPEAYHFEGMADYQHVVATHADATKRKKGSWTELHEPCLGKVNAIDVDKEDTMILVPPLFALKDVPESLVLKTPSMFTPRKKQETPHTPCEVDIEPVLAIDFNIKDIPKTVIWEKYVPQGSEEWDFQVAVSNLFEERPIWPKESLVERMLKMGLVFRHGVFRRLLSRIAYYFSSGPFQRFWIKKGYDPRKDCDSRKYQRIDFRVPQSLRSYCNSNASNEMSYAHEKICAFQVFPHKFQTSLQLFELEDEYIQEEIKKPSEETSCSYESGWFSLRILNCLRQRIMMRFLLVFPTADAEPLLRAASENFEKLKRDFKKGCLKVDQGGDHQANPAVINDDKLEANSGEEDEDGLAVESGDEALDEYDEFNMVGDDDEISLQSHSYLNMDDVSRTHLQELFGSFPSMDEDDQKLDDGDGSEEEYQIYEQDSDIDSDDDDS
ncbi:general transcription factor 3C polypeptide 5-like [Cucurbita pepo subsp. pepo]|uniref:general transcription factor 3C polypeptide 5-like n=1 Tax=Cucurbita pepo subsp. pepo TaxID=3664 RepID=UPI000C9D646F|nr:general transcription factor 3C polypeptide 5-like [Cucurbita pepo subsp. pepo]XP_023530658.1 general transcription factor 3C polypeptide 5-like [Cucurbita pepo subsp. pepo]XP_023530659.1 general transcription factor 3C polypeptide 5-like [Cucurbita pepo subsp. pepo]